MSEKEYEAQLSFREHLDYPELIREAISVCNKAVLTVEYSEQENIEATKNLRSLIAKCFEDDAFKKELDEAKVKRKIDIRPEFCGVKASEKFCKEHGIDSYVEVTTWNYEKLRQVCINFFARTGLFSSINLVEEIEEIDFAEITKPKTGKNQL